MIVTSVTVYDVAGYLTKKYDELAGSPRCSNAPANSRHSSERKEDSEDQVGLFGVGTGAAPPEPPWVSAIAISANQMSTPMSSPEMAGPPAA